MIAASTIRTKTTRIDDPTESCRARMWSSTSSAIHVARRATAPMTSGATTSLQVYGARTPTTAAAHVGMSAPTAVTRLEPDRRLRDATTKGYASPTGMRTGATSPYRGSDGPDRCTITHPISPPYARTSASATGVGMDLVAGSPAVVCMRAPRCILDSTIVPGVSTLARQVPIGALGPARDAEHHHESRGVVDQIDEPEVADAETPEVGADDLGGTEGSRLRCQIEDRCAKPGCITGRQAPQLADGRRRDLDSVSSLAHASSVP